MSHECIFMLRPFPFEDEVENNGISTDKIKMLSSSQFFPLSGFVCLTWLLLTAGHLQ